MELTVDTGSTADGRLVREINWPRHSLLVDVKRGDEELIPEGQYAPAQRRYAVCAVLPYGNCGTAKTYSKIIKRQ